MPSIIVLDSDNRTANQITSALSGLEDAKYRRFKSLEEFEGTYFDEARLDSSRGHLQKFDAYKFVNPKARQWLLKNRFEEVPVLPSGQMAVRGTHPAHFIAEWSPSIESSTTILGYGATDIEKSKHLFVEKVVDAFKRDFEEYINSCTLGAQQERLFVFKCKSQMHAALLVSGSPGPNESVLLTFRDINMEFVEAHKKEVKRIESLKQEAAELKLLKQIDIIIIRYDFIKSDAKAILSRIQSNLKRFDFKPETFRTRCIITKYEDDGVPKTKFALPEIDGLVFYPIDRSVFLQTIEILNCLPEKAEPSYLFNQQVDIEIDICKTAVLHSINEFCIAVINPVSLVNGLLGNFYVKLKDQEIRISAKVFRSTTNPDNIDEYLVFFSYFALDSKSLVVIKKFLAEQKEYEMLKINDRSQFRFDAAATDYTAADLMVKNIVVVLPDEMERAKIKNIIEEDFDRLSVTCVATFHELVTRCLPAKAGSGQGVEPAADPDFPFQDLWWVYNRETHKVIASDERFKEHQSAEFMGYHVRDVIGPNDRWKKLIGDSEMMLLKEVTRVSNDSRGKHVIELRHQDGSSRIVTATIGPDRAFRGGIRVELRYPRSNEVKSYLAPPDAIHRADAMFVDTRLLHGGVNAWIKELDEILCNRGLEFDKPLLFLNCPNLQKEKIQEFQSSRICALFHTSSDMRHIQFALSQFLSNRFNSHCFNNLNFVEPQQQIHVAKPVRVESISEYGVTISHPKPFNYGSFLFLRGDIFKEAPNSSLLARFYHNEASESDPGSYSCAMIYFGLNETFLKSLRKWFIELHVEANKEQN